MFKFGIKKAAVPLFLCFTDILTLLFELCALNFELCFFELCSLEKLRFSMKTYPSPYERILSPISQVEGRS